MWDLNHHQDSPEVLKVYIKILIFQWQVLKFYDFGYLNYLKDISVKSAGH